ASLGLVQSQPFEGSCCVSAGFSAPAEAACVSRLIGHCGRAVGLHAPTSAHAFHAVPDELQTCAPCGQPEAKTVQVCFAPGLPLTGGGGGGPQCVGGGPPSPLGGKANAEPIHVKVPIVRRIEARVNLMAPPRRCSRIWTVDPRSILLR